MAVNKWQYPALNQSWKYSMPGILDAGNTRCREYSMPEFWGTGLMELGGNLATCVSVCPAHGGSQRSFIRFSPPFSLACLL